MKHRFLPAVLAAAAFGVFALSLPAAAPVTPNASPEARDLLEFLYSISGRYTLTGQHNYPNIRDRNTQFAADYLGKTPAVFSTDWGHAKADDTDSYLARPDIVQECIRQHRRGALVTICWHAVPPTANEPITFRQLPGSDPQALKSVQGKLLDEQFRHLLTPGTALHLHWLEQVDAVAVYLKQLQDAHVPVLWRPYHEMNGDWFWWGGRGADTAALYRQIFDRLVNHHHLNNLIWVWSMDRVSKPGMEHEKYFPGSEFVDVLGLDVYGNDFAQSYYESLEKLAQGKPLALAEVGNPPSLEVMAKQPKWTYYVIWAGMVRNTTKKTYATLLGDSRFLSLGDPAYATATEAYRRAGGVPSPRTAPAAPDFSGQWVINEDLSTFGRMGAANAPARLVIVQKDGALTIRSTRILEFKDDETTEERLPLDGTDARSEFMDSPRVTTARLSGSELVTDSTISLAWGPPNSKATEKATWKLGQNGRQLTIHRSTKSFAGQANTTLVYDRE